MSGGVYGPFTWVVPEGGLRWVTTSLEPFEEKRRWMIPQTPGTAKIGRRYDLTDLPALFRNFADTPVTEEGILRFASEYGELGGPQMVVPPEDWEGPDDVWFRGESVEFWAGHITAMRDAIQVWDAVQHRDVLALERNIGTVYDENGQPLRKVLAPEPRANGLAGDPVLPALSFIRGLVQEHLLLMSPKMVVVEAEYRLTLQLSPGTLIRAMWLQFAQAIEEKRDYRQCKVCGRWFEISSKTKHRKSRQYCSDACRVRAYRERLAEGDFEE